MDLHYINEKFPESNLKRNGHFLTIGFLGDNVSAEMLIYIKNEKYLGLFYNQANVTAIITTEEIYEKVLTTSNCGVLVAEEPEKLFYLVHNFLYRETNFYKKDDFSTIIGTNAVISPNAVIAEKNVFIGDNVIIEPNVIIMEGTRIGDNCFIGANTAIGTRGFQYYRDDNEAFYIEHVGGIIIENNVEILSNSCVAKGLIKPTCLCDEVKVDNLVHIAHSAYLDKRVLVTAGVIIGGSAYIGKRAWLGVNAAICPSVHVGDDAFVCMGAVVTKDVPNGQKVSGNFAIDHKKQIDFIKQINLREVK